MRRASQLPFMDPQKGTGPDLVLHIREETERHLVTLPTITKQADRRVDHRAAWLGDTVQTMHATYAHMVPGADDRGRKAMDLYPRGVP